MTADPEEVVWHEVAVQCEERILAVAEYVYEHTAIEFDDIGDLAEGFVAMYEAIKFVLADAESQHPGGWGPDVTMVAVLKKAIGE